MKINERFHQLYSCLFTNTEFFGDPDYGLYILRAGNNYVFRICRKELVDKSYFVSFLMDLGSIPSFDEYYQKLFGQSVRSLPRSKATDIIVNFIIDKRLRSML